MKELFSPISDEEYQEFENDSSIFSSSGWLGERFKDSMTEEAYNTFLETGTYQIMMLSYENGCNIEMEKMKINEKKDYYFYNTNNNIFSSNNDFYVLSNIKS